MILLTYEGNLHNLGPTNIDVCKTEIVHTMIENRAQDYNESMDLGYILNFNLIFSKGDKIVLKILDMEIIEDLTDDVLSLELLGVMMKDEREKLLQRNIETSFGNLLVPSPLTENRSRAFPFEHITPIKINKKLEVKPFGCSIKDLMIKIMDPTNITEMEIYETTYYEN